MAIEKEQFDTNRELKSFKSVQTMQQSCQSVIYVCKRKPKISLRTEQFLYSKTEL